MVITQYRQTYNSSDKKYTMHLIAGNSGKLAATIDNYLIRLLSTHSSTFKVIVFNKKNTRKRHTVEH